MLPRPRTVTLFPYTTLFRSRTARANELPRRGLVPARLLARARGRRPRRRREHRLRRRDGRVPAERPVLGLEARARSEEHTSELQSPDQLVCRLLLEKKNEIA